MFELIVLIFTVISNLILGLFVFFKNPKALINQLFLFLSSSFIVWSVVNYASTHPVFFSQLTWIRLVLFCGAILNLAVFLVFVAFPDSPLSKYKTRVKASIVATVLIALLTLTPLVFKGLKEVNGVATPEPNFGMGLFLLQTIVLLSASIFLLVNRYRHSRGSSRQQLKIVIFAIISTITLILITNFILVLLIGFTLLVPLGPALTLIFSSSMAYAIVRHRLFDIRAAVSRSVSYLLSLGLIGLAYGVVVFLLATYLSVDLPENIQRAIYIIFALISSLLYQPIKAYFDKQTNRIFYRDAYDPEVFLDELNKTIVGNIELGILVRHTTQVMQKNLKTDFCFIQIAPRNNEDARFYGVGSLSLNKSESDFIFSKVFSENKKTIATDQLSSKDQKLKKLLYEKNIGMITRLIYSADSNTPVAYLILGSKKSGNVFTNQDVRIVDIIADELLIAIQNALRFEEIQEFNITLQQKINIATEKLQKTNKKLLQLDETKDEFISMASHQLRTPLTSVKGYMSMVLEGDAGELNEQQKNLLNQAFVSSQRMVYMIADLLNVSRLKTGKFVIDPHPTNLSDVVQSEIEQLREIAKAKKMTLSFEKPKEFPDLMLDETKIRQVIMNFCDNAIYYTKADGHIEVGLREDARNVYFTVKDNGLGVPRSEKGRLFTKFYRAQNARKARPDGTGLGLFMAKKVIDAQGGTIIFESKEGKGSTFGFTFNKKKLEVKE